MSNMSYCRFENTAHDLADCAEHILERLTSEYEIEGRVSLIRSCVRILEDLGLDVTNPDNPKASVEREEIEAILTERVAEKAGDDDEDDEV